MKKHDGAGGEHYKVNGEKEVCEFMEEEAFRIFLEHMGVQKEDVSGETETAIKKSLWGACAVKHEKRAGTKKDNPACMDLKKAINYRHKQRTGKWLKND